MCSKEEPALRILVLRNEAIVTGDIVEDNHVLAGRESDVATTCCAPSVEVACTEGQHATCINTPVGAPCAVVELNFTSLRICECQVPVVIVFTSACVNRRHSVTVLKPTVIITSQTNLRVGRSVALIRLDCDLSRSVAWCTLSTSAVECHAVNARSRYLDVF